MAAPGRAVARAIIKRPSLTFRLVGSYALLVAATLLVVVGLTAQIVESHLDGTLAAELAAAADSFNRGPAARAPTPEALAADTRRWLATDPLPAGEMAAVRIGGVVLTSARGRDLYAVRNPRGLLTASDTRWLRTSARDGRVRVLTVPIRVGRRQVGTLVLLGYENRIAATLRTLLSGVGWASGIGLAFAVLLGVLIVRRSLRPLTEMTREIESIEATGDLSRRVTRDDRDDEVSRLALAFDRLLGRLDAVFESQRRFVADAAHELRTPLTVIRGQFELSGKGDHKSLGIAVGELDHMARIVEDLLTLARIDEGMKLAREPVEVELLVREALLRALQIQAREVHVDAQPALYALADPERLLQVLTNLIRNTFEYTGRDSWISVMSAAEGAEAVISISDDGPGIAAQDLPHVFERFYRGRRERNSSDGSGLGLAIAASLVEAMGGTTSAHSTPGVVTTFTIRLPVAVAPPGSEPAADLVEPSRLALAEANRQ